jgi:hypothetical protein
MAVAPKFAAEITATEVIVTAEITTAEITTTKIVAPAVRDAREARDGTWRLDFTLRAGGRIGAPRHRAHRFEGVAALWASIFIDRHTLLHRINWIRA